MNKRSIRYLTVLVLALAAIVLWSSGVFGLWTKGMSYIANNTEDFTDQHGHAIQGNYSLKLDWSDYDSNLGKDIYDDGEHRIYVSWLQRTHDGGYDIGFRSSGKYTRSGATLVSGVHHETLNGHTFKSTSHAKMIVEYENSVYPAQPTGTCGLNYKDGDCFSFTFFLNDDSKEGNTSAEVATITMTNLYKNVWSRK